ncbi:hypothetical protein MY4038_007187 [Beauveria bassiana]
MTTAILPWPGPEHVKPVWKRQFRLDCILPELSRLALRTDGTGQLHYGTVVKEEFDGDLTTVDLTGYWSVNGGVTVNGKVIADNLNLATDSGTTVIFGPTSVVREVYKSAGITEVSTANGIQGHYSCSNSPTIGFNLGGKNFNIDPKALAFKKDGDNCTASLTASDWLRASKSA